MSLKSSCSSLRNDNKNRESIREMPDDIDSIHSNFNQLLGSLDLPADKIEEMNSYDNHKKWEILCSRSLMKIHQSPQDYLERLKSHIGLKISPSRETLRGLEVSLRTYSIEWLHDFLNERSSLDTIANIIDNNNNDTSYNLSLENFQIALQCLRVLLNDNSMGFEMAINHSKLLGSLVANLTNRKLSEKNLTLILQLLALACQKSENGQQKVLKSLKINNAQRQLMNFLTAKCIDQMLIVATLNLIRAILNTASSDMNYRVYLQYDFHKIGLDYRIERLMLNESNLISEVIDEITAYKSMIINVNQLIRDRDCGKTLMETLRNAKMKMAKMERQLIQYEEKSQEVERKKEDGLVAAAVVLNMDECKVDKIPEVDSKAEISQKSTVNIAPLMKGDTEVEKEREEEKVLVTQLLSPPPPPPPNNMMSQFFMPIKKKFNRKSNIKMPSLHWSPLRPNQIRGTIFNDINDENLRKIINFNHFEDKFSIVDKAASSSGKASPQINCIRMPKYVTLLEQNRLRNISIILRKLNFNADVVVSLINDYDFNQMKQSSSGIRLLTNLAPKDEEIATYQHYVKEKKDIVVLSDEDKFLLKLSLVERLQMKLNIIEFMATFDDRINTLTIQVCAISSASLSLKSSEKFKGILEIILTFGNYMNGNKSSGCAYGFHLKGTLEKLNEIRSSDKKQTLLQYIITDVIVQQFPQFLSIDSELSCIEAAARISMKNVANEVGSIERGWREMSDECDLSQNKTLKAFKETSLCECNKLINEFQMAQNNYKKCMEYFGESDATIDSDEFFSVVEKFVAKFKANA